jgi:hypothetical protein
MTYKERRKSVIRAVVTVAARLGVSSLEPVILRESNHTSIHPLHGLRFYVGVQF